MFLPYANSFETFFICIFKIQYVTILRFIYIFTESTKSCVQSWTHKGQKRVRMLYIAYKYNLDIIYYKYNIIFGTTSEPFNDRSTFAFV